MIPFLNISDHLKHLIELSLKEDLGNGDITTHATVSASAAGSGYVKAKSDGILCGQSIFTEVFRQVDPSLQLTWTAEDGDPLAAAGRFVVFAGKLESVLMAERTALNFLQRMSGIATWTRRYVELIRHTSAKIIDTRKTTPLWRALEKYAVSVGGGSNHRMGLYDMFLIKENHITAAGGISNAIRRALDFNKTHNMTYAIEVETRSLEEVREAMQFPLQRIMLDNMAPDLMAQCVAFIGRRCEVEASGGVRFETVRSVAETGVDFISIGALTHSAPAMDLSLIIE
jgi:nicotinate-nucleotide pyrophosphorylase (carboxylating)